MWLAALRRGRTSGVKGPLPPKDGGGDLHPADRSAGGDGGDVGGRCGCGGTQAVRGRWRESEARTVAAPATAIAAAAPRTPASAPANAGVRPWPAIVPVAARPNP